MIANKFKVAFDHVRGWWEQLVSDTRYMLHGGVHIKVDIPRPEPIVESKVAEDPLIPTLKERAAPVDPMPPVTQPDVTQPQSSPAPPRRDQLIMDADGRLVHWPEPPEPPRRTARCAYSDVVAIHCEAGRLLDPLGCDRGYCPVCLGEGSVNLQ
jgi:hypothetical protein